MFLFSAFVYFVVAFESGIDAAVFPSKNPSKNSEPGTSNASNRKARFLGRLAFLVDLGNKAAPMGMSSYMQEPRWSPYFAAMYEPFPLYPQSFSPPNLFQLHGVKEPPNITENDYQVFRDVNDGNKTSTEGNGNVTDNVSFDEKDRMDVPDDIEIILDDIKSRNSSSNEENEDFLFGGDETTTLSTTTAHKPMTKPRTTHVPTTHKPQTTMKHTVVPKPTASHSQTTHQHTTLKPTKPVTQKHTTKPVTQKQTTMHVLPAHTTPHVHQPTTTIEHTTEKEHTMEISSQQPEITYPTTTNSGFTATTVRPMNSSFHGFEGYYGGHPQHIENIFFTDNPAFQEYNDFNSHAGQVENLNNNFVHENYDNPSHFQQETAAFQDYPYDQENFEPANVNINGFRPNFIP